MKILAVGEERKFQELKKVIPAEFAIEYQERPDAASLDDFDLVFDLNFDDDPMNLSEYVKGGGLVVIVGAVKLQLAAALTEADLNESLTFIGMNTLPTFINRDLIELSLYNENTRAALERIAKQLHWNYQLVEDRVGMVTPRIIFMIINEACYTLQEGTASVEDIDMAMKLGTNYPFGPFEWADKIGLKDIYETLEAVYQDTHDERYKICPLLKTKYLRRETFY